MAKRIIVTINADGSIIAESSGNPGPACLADLPIIETLCDNAKVVDSKLAPEYFTTSFTSQLDHVQQTQADKG